MAIFDNEPSDPEDFVTIDGEMIHKNIVKRALTITKLIDTLHGQMPHYHIDPPCF